MEISNKTLAAVLVLAVVVSLAGTLISLNKLSRLSTGPTGFATGTGTATVNVSTQSSLTFAINAVEFGTGYINGTTCQLTINNSATITRGAGCNGFNATNTDGDTLILQNNGNTYLNVTLNGTNASAFLGSAGSYWQFVVQRNESGSCLIPPMLLENWTNITQTQTSACWNMSYSVGARSLRVGLNLSILQTVPLGAKTAIITAVGTDV